jgi:hypothetical protein
VDPVMQPVQRGAWLGRPLALVALDVPLPSFSQLVGTGDYMIEAEAAQLNGDTAAVLRWLRPVAASRAGMQASDIMFEALFPEARIFAAMGDRQAAIGRLDPTLRELRRASLPLVSDPVGAALLVRSMAFRSELAEAMGDSVTARKWGQVVRTLWSAADPFLVPAVKRDVRPRGEENH